MTKQLPLSLRHKGFEVFTSSYVHVQPGNGESYYQLVFTEKDGGVKSGEKDLSLPHPCHRIASRNPTEGLAKEVSQKMKLFLPMRFKQKS